MNTQKKNNETPADPFTPGIIPELKESLKSLDRNNGNTNPRFEYFAWRSDNQSFLGLKRGDLIKIDVRATVRPGDFVDVEFVDSRNGTFARLGRCTKTMVELWTYPGECYPAERSKCRLRRILGKVAMEPSARLFYSKRLGPAMSSLESKISKSLEDCNPCKDGDRPEAPPEQHAMVSLIMRTGRLLEFKPKRAKERSAP